MMDYAIAFLSGLAAGWALSRRAAVLGGREMRLISWWKEGGDLVLHTDSGVYKGSCTVWSDYRTAKRMPTRLESRLRDIWEAVKWGRHDDKRRPPVTSEER